MKVGYDLVFEMATAFGLRRLGAAFKAILVCLFSRSLTVAVLYRARKQAVPEYASRKRCRLKKAKENRR
jgi:hypothetical protein